MRTIGAPLVADVEYDAVEDELRGLIEANPQWAPDPNPLEQVGAPSVLTRRIRHSRPMLSLRRRTGPNRSWRSFGRFPGQPVVVMPKLDGLSLALGLPPGRPAGARDHSWRRDDRRRRHRPGAGVDRRDYRRGLTRRAGSRCVARR